MVWRPSLEEVEAAARVLARAGNHRRWWEPHTQTYEEMFATDLMAKSEFDGIVEQMLMAAHGARSAAT
jgi:3-dehydro-4-phosphotetronate decarboxylase